LDNWEKLKISANVVAAVFIPVVLAIFGNSYTKAIKEREVQGRFVELAVNILSQSPDEKNHNLRAWATKVIDEYSGVPLDSTTKRDLIENLRIVRTSMFTDAGFRDMSVERRIDEIIILDTQSEDIEAEIKALKKFDVAYHYLIDTSGGVRQLVEESDMAYHTRGRNANSIGIGLMHVSGKEYPESQIEALVSLLAQIADRHKIPPTNILASSQVSSKHSDLPIRLNEIRNKVSSKIRE